MSAPKAARALVASNPLLNAELLLKRQHHLPDETFDFRIL